MNDTPNISRIACPHCNAVLETNDPIEGECVNCPECGKEFVAGRERPAVAQAGKPKSKKKLVIVIALLAVALLLGLAKCTGGTRTPVVDKDSFKTQFIRRFDQSFGKYEHEARWDGDTLVINVWDEDLTLGALFASAGYSDASDAWNAMRGSLVRASDSFVETAKDNGFEGHAIINMIAADDPNTCLLSVCDGVVVYDATLM